MSSSLQLRFRAGATEVCLPSNVRPVLSIAAPDPINGAEVFSGAGMLTIRHPNCPKSNGVVLDIFSRGEPFATDYCAQSSSPGEAGTFIEQCGSQYGTLCFQPEYDLALGHILTESTWILAT